MHVETGLSVEVYKDFSRARDLYMSIWRGLQGFLPCQGPLYD